MHLACNTLKAACLRSVWELVGTGADSKPKAVRERMTILRSAVANGWKKVVFILLAVG